MPIFAAESRLIDGVIASAKNNKNVQPGEELDWTVRWYVEPTDLPAQPSKALLKKARSMLK